MQLRRFVLPVLMCLAMASATAQETIQPNPNAVRLREIWRATDSTGNWGQYGHSPNVLPGVGPLGVGFVAYGSGKWWIWTLDTDGVIRSIREYPRRQGHAMSPLIGRQMVDGRDVLLVEWDRDSVWNGYTYYLQQIDFYPIDSGRIADSPLVRWKSYHLAPPWVRVSINSMLAADLDQDGADELILTPLYQYTIDSLNNAREVWIHRGGENFRPDSPSVILHSGHGSSDRPYVARLDDDPFPDIALYGVGQSPIRVLWGHGTLPRAEEAWQLVDAGVAVIGEKVIARIDSDDVDDVVGSDRINDSTVVYSFYLTTTGKPPRARPYGASDYDVEWRLRVPASKRGNVGPLADTLQGKEMIALSGFRQGDYTYLVFGGDGKSIDTRYDAWFPETRYRIGGNLDANQDGWTDVLLGNPEAGFNNGLVVILAGGPYIPRDSLPPSAIRSLPAEGHAGALSVWPNPATVELHIAWRGDLKRMPARILVHDLLGRTVAQGSIEPRIGAARWDCSRVARGQYRLTFLGSDESVIATTGVILE